MGKRKERRIAAMSATSRRVKLDLFAEPNGDLSGSSAQDEVGRDTSSKHHTGLPSSPSSSDRQLENPLLLLGQYSDDELDEESSKRLDHASANNFSAELNGQVTSKEGEDVDENVGEDVAAQKIQLDVETSMASLEALQKSEDNDASSSCDTGKEMDLTEQTSVPVTSDMLVVEDVSSGWKMVLHEESNRHYYWNTVTGETSWEVPGVLALGTELICEQRTVFDTEGRESADLHESGSTLDKELEVEVHNGISSAINRLGAQVEVQNDGYESEILEDRKEGSGVNGGDTKDIASAINALYHEISALEENVSPRQSDDVLLRSESALDADSVKYTDGKIAHDEDETGTGICYRLVRHCECLLERLRSLEGSKCLVQVHERISKYKLEVEIRLSDINSLLSYGSSLLPFWVHSERHLKQLEVAISDEVLESYKPEEMTEVVATYNSVESVGPVGDDIKADGYEKIVVHSPPEKSHTSADAGITTELQKDSHYVDSDYDTVNTLKVSSIGYTATYSVSDTREEGEIYEGVLPAEPTPETVLHDREDVDMDVDMEVEDGFPAGNATIAQGFTPMEHPIQPNPPVEHGCFVPEEEFGVPPPPPGEDWIPPPPPDNEPIPPPPPDEPPEPSYPPPPSYSETVHPLSHTEQYSLSYPGSNFEYYGQTHTEVPGSSFYAHQPLYYEAVPGTYSGGAPVFVNSVEPAAYYDLQDGTIAPQPIVISAESSAFPSASGSDTHSSEFKSVEAKSESNSTFLPNPKVDISTVSEDQRASIEVPFTPSTIQAPATFSMTESVSVSSTTAVTNVAVAAPSTSAKVQPKVVRSKKRAVGAVPTLRSNKKVSSLVDKWKAAKEELHEEEEDEPDNAYEILEKKRQREIEEWRAQQIASGEAKDNANFQPLGGDWRARVKRRRAKMTSEAEQTPSECVNDGNQQPDLNELSRDLPSGWQAYWDESSKQVYYGNSATSETTWIRPTN